MFPGELSVVFCAWQSLAPRLIYLFGGLGLRLRHVAWRRFKYHFDHVLTPLGMSRDVELCPFFGSTLVYGLPIFSVIAAGFRSGRFFFGVLELTV